MTTTTTRRPAALVLLAALTLGAAACGGGGSDTADAEEISATLAIISTNIETDRDARGFEAATEGETLTVGDRVKTDPTGFAELTYHDGSWQRIEHSATLTIDELTNAGDTNTVRTSVDVGDTWNRVETLTEPDDTYELDTPVATAAVRGTAFATQCPTADECTFSVIEGTVEVTPRTGDPVTLTAGQQLTITTDTPPGEPTDPGVGTLQQDPFIAENLTLDQTKTTDTSDNGNGDDTEGATGDLDPCGLLTGEEVSAILEANRSGVTAYYAAPSLDVLEVTGAGAAVDATSCAWPFAVQFRGIEMQNELILEVTEDATSCTVEAGGTCVVIGDDLFPKDATLPPAVESALVQRLGG